LTKLYAQERELSRPVLDELMDDDAQIRLWIEQLKQGDSTAAHRLWDRYHHRLVGLARKKLRDSPRRVMDEEDVAQNAFVSFCDSAQAGMFPDLNDESNLWPLLVIITARKAATQRLHERRAKRGGGRVRSETSGDGDSEFAQTATREPTPDEVAEFSAELESFMDRLEDPIHRVMLLWKLEERTNQEIARHLDCSLSGVERKLREIRRLLEVDLAGGQRDAAT
jgi:RNA polymerase sigma factor (sigma-70 family)